MKNVEMAADYAYRATRCLREAELALSEGDFPGTIRRAQEALELALKAVLRALAVEYPREHDVGDALAEVKDRLPGYLAEKMNDIQKILTELARVRGPAFYGYEREGIPARRAFGEEYAMRILGAVREYVGLCRNFLREMGIPASS